MTRLATLFALMLLGGALLAGCRQEPPPTGQGTGEKPIADGQPFKKDGPGGMAADLEERPAPPGVKTGTP